MVKHDRSRKSVEKIKENTPDKLGEQNSLERFGADKKLFSDFMKSFGDKEEYRSILSSFLEKSEDFLGKIGNIKIDINHIKKFEPNEPKPDISESLQEKIVKLYLNKLYSACIGDTSLILKLNEAFEINIDIDEEKVDKESLKKIKTLIYNKYNKDDIDRKTMLELEKLCDKGVLDYPLFLRLSKFLGEETICDIREKIRDDERNKLGSDGANLSKIRTIIDGKQDIDFKKLKVTLDKLYIDFQTVNSADLEILKERRRPGEEDLYKSLGEKINSTTISNLEIFHSLKMNVKHNSDFLLQDPSVRDDVLSLLQFETMDINEYVKLWGEKLGKDMMDAVLPLNNVSDIFNDLDNNPKISELKLKKVSLEEITLLDENELDGRLEEFDSMIMGKEGVTIDGHTYKLEYCDNISRNINKKGEFVRTVDGKATYTTKVETPRVLPDNSGGNYIRDLFNKVREKYLISNLDLDSLEEKGIPNIEDLRDFLSGRMEFSVLKARIKETIETIDRQIWDNYLVEKIGKNPEFVQVLHKLYFNHFDISKLDAKEQTIFWQNLVTNKFDEENSNSRLKYTGLDQGWYKDFLKDLYDFEKDDLSIDVLGVGELNLKINKEIKKIKNESDVEKGEKSTFSNIENLSDLDERNPLVFTVDISGNDEDMIKDLEETKDSPLRENGIMETYITNSRPLNIGNGYTLKICGKTITKAQFDEFMDCDFDDRKLKEKLEKVGLYDNLKELLDSVKNEKLKKKRDLRYHKVKNEKLKEINGYGPNGYEFCIFEQMLKKLDVEVVERKLIFEGKDINKLSQLYILAKLHGNGENKQLENDQDEKVFNLFSKKDLAENEEGRLKNLLNTSELSLSDFPLKKGNKVSIGGNKCEYIGIDNGKLAFKPANGGELQKFGSFKELQDAGIKFDLKSKQEVGSDQQNVFDELVKIEGLQERKKELEENRRNLESEINRLTSSNENGKNDDVVAGKKEKLNQVKSELDKTNKVLDAYRSSGEKKEGLGGKEEGEKYADEIFEKINDEIDECTDTTDGYIMGDDTERLLVDRWNSLNNDGKQSFENKLNDLIDSSDDYRINDDLKDYIKGILYDREDGGKTREELEKELGITEKQEKEKSEEEKFQEARQNFSGDKKCLFEKGIRLYFSLGESLLPPKGNTAYYCFKIDDVGENTFTLKAVGGELKSSLKDKTWTFSRTVDSLQQLREGGNVFKVGSIKGKDRDSCIKNINNSNFFGDKGLKIFGEGKDKIQLKGDKFVKEIDEDGEKKEVEVKYFHGENFGFDDEAGKQGQKKYKYEVKKIDTSKGTVKFVANFNDYNEKGESTKYSCENELTFEQFILLIEGKSLLGASKEEQDAIDIKYGIDDPGRRANKGNRKWISIGAIINVVKNGRKAFDAKMDERKKEQEENLDNFLFSYEGLNLWNKIGGFAGMMGLRGVSSACNELYYDFYTNRENRTWKKIDKRCKVFEAEPNYSECYKEVLLPILKEPGCKMYADDDTRYRFAAAFLLMLKNEGPYPRDFGGDLGKGVWVEKFLGSGHAEKFRKFYNEKKLEIERDKNLGYSSDVILARQEELNKMEVTYIYSIIDGLAPYNDGAINEFESKSIWGLKFKDKLIENFSGYFDKHNETKNKMSTFFAAEEQYLRTIGAGRFNKALPSLERMCEKAESSEEAFRTKGYLLGAMLMGVIKNNSSVSTIKSFFNTCRSMGFAPGSWMKDVEQQRKVQILLDGATNGEFSKDPKLKYNISDFNPGAIKDGKYGFVKRFESYWNANGEEILKKIEKPSYKDNPNDKSIMEMAADENNPNRSVFAEYISNSRTVDYDTPNPEVGAIWEKTAPWAAISNKVKKYIPSKGYYSNLTKEEDKDDAQKFWEKAAREIPTGKVDKISTEDTFMRFFSWFDTKIAPVKRNIVKSLKYAQKLEKQGYHGDVEYILSYLIRGNMHRVTGGIFPAEFGDVVENFRKFFINNIENIDDGIIDRTFENDRDLINAFKEGEDMIMFNWQDYKRYKMNNYRSGGGSSDRSRYADFMQLQVRKLNYENRKKPNYRELTLDNDVINTEIENIWKQCNSYRSPESDTSAGIPFDPNLKKETIREQLMSLSELEKMD